MDDRLRGPALLVFMGCMAILLVINMLAEFGVL